MHQWKGEALKREVSKEGFKEYGRPRTAETPRKEYRWSGSVLSFWLTTPFKRASFAKCFLGTLEVNLDDWCGRQTRRETEVGNPYFKYSCTLD